MAGADHRCGRQLVSRFDLCLSHKRSSPDLGAHEKRCLYSPSRASRDGRIFLSDLTTDAAGNWSRGLIYAYPTNGVRQIWGRMKNGAYIPPPEHHGMDGYFYHPGLWPNQPWKVRLEFIQGSGFSDDEMVTFTNIPVKPGSQKDTDDEWTWDASNTNLIVIAQGKANGVCLKLLPPLMFTNENSTGHPKDVSIIIGADPGFNPKGMNLTVVAATDDQGRDLWSFGGSPWAGHYSIEF